MNDKIEEAMKKKFKWAYSPQKQEQNQNRSIQNIPYNIYEKSIEWISSENFHNRYF